MQQLFSRRILEGRLRVCPYSEAIVISEKFGRRIRKTNKAVNTVMTDYERKWIMRYVKECAILFGVTLAGELFNELLPFPVPAGVYGLFLLLLLLCSRRLKLEQVEHAGGFLLEIMPVLFVPASVGLMESYGEMQEILIPIVVISLVSTVIVMAVTGKTAEWMMRRKEETGK